MQLAILEIYRSGDYFIVNHRQEKGDVLLDDKTVLVSDSQSVIVKGVSEHFRKFPEDRMVSVYVLKGQPTYVVKDSLMRGLFFNTNSKIIHYSGLGSEIYEHLDFHTVKMLGDLAA